MHQSPRDTNTTFALLSFHVLPDLHGTHPSCERSLSSAERLSPCQPHAAREAQHTRAFCLLLTSPKFSLLVAVFEIYSPAAQQYSPNHLHANPVVNHHP